MMPSDSYNIRMGLFDTRLWSAQNLVDLYKTELTKAGFVTNQLPSVSYPKVSTKLKSDAPFPGARTIVFTVPVFGEFEQTRDMNVPYEQDQSKLAEAGKVNATIFTWNVCSSEKTTGDPLGVLRDIFRRVKLTGITKLSPKISKYSDTPLMADGYPDKQVEPECVTKKSIPSPVRKNTASNTGIWTLLLGLGISLLTKGKV